MSDAPRVSVLLPVYQGREYLAEAIDSMLAQTFRDFELLVIDDGSSDGSADVAAAYVDPRVRCVRNERNLGLIASLNRGLELARGEIVARMDADDRSLPQRLRLQIDFLDANPQVGACGASMRSFGGRDDLRNVYPASTEDIRCQLLFDPAMAHATVCLRRAWFARHGLRYDERYPHAEDYDLWRRAIRCFPLGNLREVLYCRRHHDERVTRRHRDVQLASTAQIHKELLLELGIAATQRELLLHHGGRFGEPAPPLGETEGWLLGLLRANRDRALYPQAAFERALAGRWLRACRRSIGQGQRVFRHFAGSPLSRLAPLGARLRVGARAAAAALGRPRAASPSRNPAI